MSRAVFDNPAPDAGERPTPADHDRARAEAAARPGRDAAAAAIPERPIRPEPGRDGGRRER